MPAIINLAMLLCAAVMAVPTAWAINCDVVFPATTFQAPLYNVREAQFTPQAWLVSPSAPSNNTPSGSTSCGYPAYLAHYDVDGVANACISAVGTTSNLVPTATGCTWNLYQFDGYYPLVVNFNMVCDPNANAAIVPPANVSVYIPFIEQGGTTKYWATVTSNLVCGAAPLFRIAKKP